MKKILTLTVALSLVLLGATGCGDDSSASTTATDETTTTTSGSEQDAVPDATEGDVGDEGGEATPPAPDASATPTES